MPDILQALDAQILTVVSRMFAVYMGVGIGILFLMFAAANGRRRER